MCLYSRESYRIVYEYEVLHSNDVARLAHIRVKWGSMCSHFEDVSSVDH